jgi:hypothetical protein
MKYQGQGRKDYILIVNGEALGLFTINKAIKGQLYFEKHGDKVKIVNYKHLI